VLTPDEVSSKASELWKMHYTERAHLDRIRGYARGELGLPRVPADADSELRELANLSVKNIMTMVCDSFTQALSVTGFRSPSQTDSGPVWDIWQRERMDARQAQVYRPAVRYGASYLRHEIVDGKVRMLPRSPRALFAVYEDPTYDKWPLFALETWEDKSLTRTGRMGVMYDETHAYPITMRGSSGSARVDASEDVDPYPHGFDVCPVVRFVNQMDGDLEDAIIGEVEPLIVDQRAINNVNFDRLIVSRFGAFPQKYIMGWTPENDTVQAKASAARLMAFPEVDTKAGSFTAASLTGYNELLGEMIAAVAVKARASVFALTGDISNVGAETIALIDAPNQRKIDAKRESFGESWEQSLTLAASVENIDVDPSAGGFVA